MHTRALRVPLRQSLNRWSRLVSVFMASWMLWACSGDQGPMGNDVKPPVALGVSDGMATGREWRTTPLWGLRLMRGFLNGEAFLLHDGRARTVEEAIRLHGGEARSAR